jgi:NADH dehydrogenase
LKEGRLLARNVVATLYGGDKKKFDSKIFGQLAAIGHRRGVANILGLNFSGFLAWWLYEQFTLASCRGWKRRYVLPWIGRSTCFSRRISRA